MRLSITAVTALAIVAMTVIPSRGDAQDPPSPTADGSSAVRSFADHPVYAQARSLLAARNSGSAYDLLLPLDKTFAGDPDFDYLLGIASLDSGRSSQAVFSLQRVVAGNPAFIGARLDLARAYFDAGDNDDARREFEIVSRQEPPISAAAAIAQYQAAIDRRTGEAPGVLRSSIEVSAGQDSNANAGTDSDQFLGIPLGEASRTAESVYYGAAARLAYVRELAPRLRWQSGAQLRHREYPDASFVSSSVGQIGTGVAFGSAQSFVAVDLSGRWTALDGAANQRIFAVDLSTEQSLSGSVSIGGSLRLAQVNYPGTIDALDVDQTLAGVALRWRPANSQRALDFSAGPILGREKASGSSPFGRDLVGGRFAASLMALNTVWRGSLGLLQSDYDGSFFGRERKDDQITAQLEFEVPRLFGSAWVLRPSLTYIDNRSDLSLFEYDRLDAGVALVRGF
ncbi:MAG: tetratricopeptide repeat protein [Panacagrimonas sp.]